MSHAYLIEIEQDTVGLIVREAEGYRFYATRRSLTGLQRNLFDTAWDAHHAVLDLHGPAAVTHSSMIPLHRSATAE
jgi:hypothetical protein